MDWVGYRWLVERYGLRLVQPMSVQTRVGTPRSVVRESGRIERAVSSAMRPDHSLAGHLTFALKNEGVQLELLSRLFATVDPDDLVQWVRREPTGQYARRAGFFYERLTGRTLAVDATPAGNYTPALNPEMELVSARPVRDTRWRVMDNLLGDARFTPQVRFTSTVRDALQFDILEHINSLEQQFSADLVMRSAIWMTVKESRSSFAIENEGNKTDRIQRFASVIGSLTGKGDNVFDQIEAVQREILGPAAIHRGYRQSPVFVGETLRNGEQAVHYFAPDWKDVPHYMAGLKEMMRRTEGLPSAVRAALISFGFVYIHPLVDGNGRMSRFLINDTLRRDGVLPAPFIVPVSATFMHQGLKPMSYDGALEVLSKPLTDRYSGMWRFGDEKIAADGVRHNFEFEGYSDANHAWRFPDMTEHVVFMANALDIAINKDMRDEALYLKRHSDARALLKNVIEGPDSAIDRIIRSIRENRFSVSGKLRSEYPQLQREDIAAAAVEAVRQGFSWQIAQEGHSDDANARDRTRLEGRSLSRDGLG